MSDADGDEEPTLWWGEPNDARRFHVFEGETTLAESLCGSWAMGYMNDEEVDPEADTYREGKDCKECSREAGVLADE